MLETAAPVLPNPFPLARYRLECVIERRVDLPEYAGSMLRGAFGHALKHVVCVTGAPRCEPCPLFRTCQYPGWFETPPPPSARRVYSSIPHPFVIEPPALGARTCTVGERLEFGMVAVGPALAQVRPALLAWRRALESGLGAAQGRARLERVWLEGDTEPVFEAVGGRWREHGAGLALPASQAAPASAAIKFDTPVRVKRGGRILGADELVAADVLFALLRRAADVADMLLGQAPAWDFAALKRASSQIGGASALRWMALTRYSSRQGRDVPLDGVIGKMVLEGDLRPFWPLLYLGQWLHLGGKATFGLGRYRLVAP